jgi:hypothetical protein
MESINTENNEKDNIFINEDKFIEYMK